MNIHSRDRLLRHNPSIPGWANMEILEALGKYASMVGKHGVILEIGGLFGRSTYTLGYNKDESVKLITIDNWPTMYNNTLHDGNTGVEELTLFNSKLNNNWISGEDFFNLWDEFTKGIPNKEGMKIPASSPNENFPMIDFLYHDAGHEYKEVYDDLKHWFPKVKADGIIIVDDYDPHSFPGVIKAVDQFVMENNLYTEMITWRNILLRRKV